MQLCRRTFIMATAAVVALLALTSAFVAAEQQPATCTGVPMAYPLNTDPPKFVARVANGKRFIAGKGNDTFHVVHLYGTPYEMGFAMGQLMSEEVKTIYPKFMPFIERHIRKALPWLPKWLADIITKDGVFAALGLTYDVTKAWQPKAYNDEMNGIAAGAGVDVNFVRAINMFPELTKAACTIIGANGKATAGARVKGSIAHLRALDFDANAPMVDFASIVVYHGQANSTRPKVMNFGWVPMVGVLTGFSSTGMGVGEKAWGGPEKIKFLPWPGEPWMFILRDVLQEPTMSAVINKLQTASKTVAIHVGVGDAKSNRFLGFEIATNLTKIYNWTTHRPSPTHPLFEDVTYWSKNDPARTMCPADLLRAQQGNITAEWLAMKYSPADTTGDTHMIAFDYGTFHVYVANARKTGSAGPLHAYNRQRTRVDMRALFNEKS